ncbi:MAG: ribbon-helix-helix domain-containing protein [Nitrolancea sp.]
MTNERVRIRITMSKALIADVDRLVGLRHRSEFVTDAVRQKLSRERLRRAALELGGSLADKHIPGWESTESAAEWVRSLRQEFDASLNGH